MLRHALVLLCITLTVVGCSRAKRAKYIQPATTSAQTMSSRALATDLHKLTDQIVRDLEREAPAGLKRNLAVTDFVAPSGEASELGRFLAEEVTTRLIQSGKVRIVERSLLDKVLAEQKMGASQLVDDDTAARVGQMIGADTLCTGTVTLLGDQVRVNTRLLRANTAEAFAAAAATFPLSSELQVLVGQRPATPTEPQKAAPVVFLRRPIGTVRPQTLVLRNNSGYCLRISLNGAELKIFDKEREVVCIPPGDKSFVELDGFGSYTLVVHGSQAAEPFTAVARHEQTYFVRERRKGGTVIVLGKSDLQLL